MKKEKSFKTTYPNGYLPLLEIEGKKLYKVYTIAHYLSKKSKLS